MLITFKSKAAPNILMYEKDAKRLLDLLGKDSKRGVITKDEAAAALETLQSEIATVTRTEQEAPTANTDEDGRFGEDREHEQAQTVSFSTRAYPFLEMLRAAQRSGNDVLWGV